MGEHRAAEREEGRHRDKGTINFNTQLCRELAFSVCIKINYRDAFFSCDMYTIYTQIKIYT